MKPCEAYGPLSRSTPIQTCLLHTISWVPGPHGLSTDPHGTSTHILQAPPMGVSSHNHGSKDKHPEMTIHQLFTNSREAWLSLMSPNVSRADHHWLLQTQGLSISFLQAPSQRPVCQLCAPVHLFPHPAPSASYSSFRDPRASGLLHTDSWLWWAVSSDTVSRFFSSASPVFPDFAKAGEKGTRRKPGGDSFPQLGLSGSSQSLRSRFGGLPLFQLLSCLSSPRWLLSPAWADWAQFFWPKDGECNPGALDMPVEIASQQCPGESSALGAQWDVSAGLQSHTLSSVVPPVLAWGGFCFPKLINWINMLSINCAFLPTVS